MKHWPLLLISLLVLIRIELVNSCDPPIPNGFTKVGSHYYFYSGSASSETLDWNDAKAKCESMNSILVEILDDEMYGVVKAYSLGKSTGKIENIFRYNKN